MRSFEILREEHYLIERVMRVLSFLLIEKTFRRSNFDLFLNYFYQVFVGHLMKEKAMFTFLCETLTPESEIPISLLEKSEEIRNELDEARRCWEEKADEDFAAHIEEFILLFSRHIYQQENSLFAHEEDFSNRSEEKILRVFTVYDRMIGRRITNSLIYFLEEMERETRHFINP